MNLRTRDRELQATEFETSQGKTSKTPNANRSMTDIKTIHKSKRQIALQPIADNQIKNKPHFSCTKSTTTYYSRDTLFRIADHLASNIDTNTLGPDANILEYLNDNFIMGTELKIRKCKSPLKVPSGFKTGINLVQYARFDNRPHEVKPASEKQKIVQNIYYKNDKYYYSNKIQFSTVLQKIYYENYKINDIKEYILPCFKSLSSVRAYFDILFKEAKSFSEAVKSNITSKIAKLVIKNGDCDTDETNYGLKTFKFVPFSKACKKYEYAIDLLHDNYRHLELINVEIEKLTRIYLENYVEKNKPLSFDTLLFHRSMFINNVYKDGLIHSFIEHLFDYFKEKTFYSNNFPTAVEKISEIFENLEFNFNFDDDNESHNEEIANSDDGFITAPGGSKDLVGDKVTIGIEVGYPKKSKKNKKKKKKAKKCIDTEPIQLLSSNKESDEVDSLYTLFCSRVDKLNRQYGSFVLNANKPAIVFSDMVQERFDKLIVCP